MNDLLGKNIEFRSGISLPITLPHEPEEFKRLPDGERLLSALKDWTRVYSYPDGNYKSMHVIATADGCEADSEILLYRIDLRQPQRVKPGPRPVVDIVGGAVMTYEECGKWLVELFCRLAGNPDQSKIVKLARPRPPKQKSIRFAWVGPEFVDGLQMPLRIRAIGQVFGADLVHVAPRSFAHVANRLAQLSPFDSVIICSGYAPYIGVDAVPIGVRRDLIHLCDSKGSVDLEQQIVSWIEIASAELEKLQQNISADENSEMLRIMLRGMLSHSKIGPFNHCQKTTVLTGVKARRLNVAAAERVLDENSEAFQDTKASSTLFLWKGHHDGDQYFLNPQMIEKVKLIVGVQVA